MNILIERLKDARSGKSWASISEALSDAIAAIEAAERALEPFSRAYSEAQQVAQLHDFVGNTCFRQASEALKLIRSSPSSAEADPQADQAASRGEL